MIRNRPVIIYVSASPDLMAEREELARMIAELPVTLAWQIVMTPAEAEPIDGAALQEADLYLLVMGEDIRAPVGLELYFARQAGHPVMAYLKYRVVHTPAGQVFARQAQVNWHSFVDAAHLSRQVQWVVAGHLLRQAALYGLTPVELEQLETLQAANSPSERTVEGEGAGHSAVLLSRERYEPDEGMIVGD